MKKIVLIILAAVSLGLNAQTPSLIEDVNMKANGSNPIDFYEFQDKLYFSAEEDNDGRELYVYDKNAAIGNQIDLVADIYQGFNSSSPTNFMEFNGKLYFAAVGNGTGAELFVYDGVTAPSLVADINPGLQASNPFKLTVFDNKLYFFADGTGSNDRELWSYDGVNPPALVYNLNASGSSAYLNTSDIVVLGNKLYYTAIEGPSFLTALYEYDGTNAPTMVAGTQGISTITNNNATDLHVFMGAIYFKNTTTTSSGGTELYKYDGTTLTMVSNTESDQTAFVSSSTMLYYRAWTSSTGFELFEYDGLGTPSIVEDLNLGNANGFANNLTILNDELYFTSSSTNDGSEVWYYDGSNAPSQLSDFYPGNLGSNPAHLTVYENNLMFIANDDSGLFPFELVEYDGVNPPAYVEEIAEINFGNKDGVNPYTMTTISYNGEYYFFGDNGDDGFEVWKYDGTNTTLFADLNVGSGGTSAGSFEIFDNQLYIGTSQGLWYTDGVVAPTQVYTSGADHLKAFNGKLYFKGSTPAQGEELWVYDGTNPASLVAEIYPGSQGSRPEQLTVADGLLYFTPGLGANEGKIYSYDGTGSPSLLPNTNGYDEASSLTVFGNKLYFISDESTPFGPQERIWKVDGALAPYTAITDHYGPRDLGVYNNQLVFDGFILSGVTPGPNRLFLFSGSGVPTEIDPNGLGEMNYFTQVGSDLYFSANPANRYVLCKYSGVGLPEALPSAGAPGSSNLPRNISDYNGNVIFSAETAQYGRELFTLCDIDNGITNDGTVLTATTSGLSYQWINCASPSDLIAGATSQSFTPTQTGDYACFVFNGTCEVQTACETITTSNVGLSQLKLNDVVIYPNPSTEVLNVTADTEISNITIFNLVGKTVYQGKETTISISHFESGVYQVLIETDLGTTNKKLIKR